MAARIRIGTSGWHYQHWKGCFYPSVCSTDKMLEIYQQHFDTVEVNNSFYKLPSPETFQAWRRHTPRNFVFAVKASRFITHNKKLGDTGAALENFLPRAQCLGEKLGPVLFQLPPQWKVNLDRLEQFLRVLSKRARREYAFEFRNPTWLIPETYAILKNHDAALCIYDLAGFATPLEITADWTYLRLHGPGGKYQGSYSTQQLSKWARQIRRWSASLKHIYAYFDNDQAGYAAQNALTLKGMVERAERSSANRAA
jgi:uncharacterized protein YecE (DUF72 family)